MADPLIPPIDWTAYDLTPSQPYFATAFGQELGDLDNSAAAVPHIAQHHQSSVLPDIAPDLDKPLKTLDDGLAFEDQEVAADEAQTVTDPTALITQGFLDNETTIGKVQPEANKLPASMPPVAGVPVTPAPVPVQPPAPKLPPVGSGVGPPLGGGAQAFISNINRPGAPGNFRVGDPWQITIKAPAGSAIYVVASHNGVSLGQSPFGVIPASGIILLHGTFTADQLGSWIENWYAGTKFISQIVFRVE